MKHLKPMLCVSSIYTVYNNGNQIVKMVLEDDDKVCNIPVSTAEIKCRDKSNSKKTIWMSAEGKESTFYSDENNTLCLRLPAPADGHFDCICALIRPIDNGAYFLPKNSSLQIEERDKNMIAHIGYSACVSMLDLLIKKDEETAALHELLIHHENTIAQLKKDNQVPLQKIKSLVNDKLASLSAKHNKNFSLTRDAETLAYQFVGEDTTPLLRALEKTAEMKSRVYSDVQNISIDNTDIIIEPKVEAQPVQTNNVFEAADKRHSKVIAQLEKIENAFNNLTSKGIKPTASNVANEMKISPAALTMWFDKHSEDTKRLCDANPDLCKNSRTQFDPVKNAISGKRNKANRA
ncbi:MAG: hypothetical protein HUK15_00040 [Bacteroidales bacterium]|nr:hypothetical protein [Bacteroidales bacterium]